MSHFIVMVVGEDIEKQLRPYHEYECTGIEDEYVIFVPADMKEVDEDFEKYKNDYKSKEEFMRDWYGYEFNDELEVWGRKTNPNAKWYCWQIGGRWSNSLILINGLIGDSVLKKYIDVEAMEKLKIESVTKRWNNWHSEIKYLSDDDKKREEWIRKSFGWFPTKLGIEHLNNMSREEYITCKSIWAPHALVWNDKWYQKGEMTRWGMSIDEESNWGAQFKELWKEIPDNEMITVVDCHI